MPDCMRPRPYLQSRKRSDVGRRILTRIMTHKQPRLKSFKCVHGAADYIGCMKTGPIQTDVHYRWHEPQHEVLAHFCSFLPMPCCFAVEALLA